MRQTTRLVPVKMLLLAAGLFLIRGVLADFKVHDASFQPNYVLEATEGAIKVNCESRHSVTINGTSPGPTLMLREGETTWVRVHNRMPHLNITLHWHGLTQRAAPFSDGTPLVSQWPIPPGHFFDYEIRPERGDAGTYYYHSHVGFQLLTAHGALIVQDANQPPYQYDEDRTLLVSDHYAAADEEIEAGLLADPFRWSGEPQAVAIQGHSGRSAAGSAADPSCAPHVVDVEPGKTYRLRVMGATVLSLVKIGIEGHKELTVIEADGEYTEPATVDHMQVSSGQRFSYLLKTKSADEVAGSRKSQFWIRYESRERPQSIAGWALLRYRMPKDKEQQQERKELELPRKSPVCLPMKTNNYLEYTLQSKSAEVRSRFPRLKEVTRTVTIQINQKLTTGKYVDGKLNGALVWVQNEESWKEDVQAAKNQVPYLVDMYKNKKEPNYTLALDNGGFDPSSRTFPARVGEVLEIVWQNNGGITGNFDFHPMHIHGEHAWDIGSGNGTYQAEENEKRFDNYVPARRDTTILHRYMQKGVPQTTAGWRAWRIRVTEENVGAWMMHCHIAQHAVMGMNTVWMFGDAAAILKKFPTVDGYIEYGGSAYGNEARDPMVNHYYDGKGKEGKKEEKGKEGKKEEKGKAEENLKDKEEEERKRKEQEEEERKKTEQEEEGKKGKKDEEQKKEEKLKSKEVEPKRQRRWTRR